MGALATLDAAALERRLLVITGIGGEPYFEELFGRWTETLVDVATERLALTSEHVVVIGGGEDHPPPTKTAVLEALSGLAGNTPAESLVMVVLLGHGTESAKRASFNLKGPDLSAEEFDDALNQFANQRIAIVNTTASSAAFIPALSGENRIIITATGSRSEQYHTEFATHWIDGLAAPEADSDKDKRISLLEVFNYAKRATERAYEADGRLLTEHPLLDDDGDGQGSREPSIESGDGPDAHGFYFQPSAATGSLAQELEARRLVERIGKLKREKTTYTEADYFERLEALLVELAENRRAIQ
ncbi:MAG: hypothetical protein AAF493_16015 [Pseudomonadota bacterium]